MSINNYNIDEQVKLIKFAEIVLARLERDGNPDRFEDYDGFIDSYFGFWISAEELFPDRFPDPEE